MRGAFLGGGLKVSGEGDYPMSLDIRSHMPLAVDLTIDDTMVEKRMQRIEIALLLGATSIAIVLFSVVSVLIHLS